MADPGRHAHQHRRIILLTDFKRRLDHVFRFLTVARFHHADFGELGIPAVILLVLRRMATRIVRADQHKSPVHTAVGKTEQRIGRDIDADHLHGGQRPAADDRNPDRRLQRHFFIRRPFGDDIFLKFGDIFKDFRTGSSRVRRSIHYASLPGALSYRLISRQQRLHLHPSSPAPMATSRYAPSRPLCSRPGQWNEVWRRPNRRATP